jgi:hypothetical protein
LTFEAGTANQARVNHTAIVPLAAALLAAACRGGPCPPDTELIGSQKTTQQSCSYQDSNGRVVRHGPFIEWHANGRKSEEGSYRHGKPDGHWTYWDENGREIVERDFRDGELLAEKRL